MIGTISKKYEVLSIIINELSLFDDISRLLNISVEELNMKLNKENGSDFYHYEVVKVCEFLGIRPDILFF